MYTGASDEGQLVCPGVSLMKVSWCVLLGFDKGQLMCPGMSDEGPLICPGVPLVKVR